MSRSVFGVEQCLEQGDAGRRGLGGGAARLGDEWESGAVGATWGSRAKSAIRTSRTSIFEQAGARVIGILAGVSTRQTANGGNLTEG
ncbi:hypothetical protein [Streptomyces atratus]|uniref:hypothetical protein n=1 Tax=Streptomyces atratus TaxID=1893 RepID=UPI0022536C0F|nr:hypothetical protein [Streptomyces atratus]MCX5338821.1 hypothetical protein [Streptomyces atratus]